MKREPIACAVCGELFEPVGTQKLCSPACRRAAKTTHQRAWEARVGHARTGSDPGRAEAVARRAERDRAQGENQRHDEIAASLAAREREAIAAWRSGRDA